MISEIGDNLLKFINTFLTLNNDFYSTLLKVLVETCRATGIVLSALLEALTHVGLYLLSCGMDLMNILWTFIGMCYTLGVVLCQILTILLTGLNVIGGCIAACAKSILKCLITYSMSIFQWLSPTLYVIRQIIKDSTLHLLEGSKNAVLATASYISFLSITSFKNLASLLLYYKERTLCCFFIIKQSCINFYDQITILFESIFSHAAKSIPRDLGIWILSAFCMFYIFLCVKRQLAQRGLTFPSFSVSSNEVLIELDDNQDYDAFDSSEEEVEEGEVELITDDSEENYTNSSDDSFNTYVDDSDVDEYDVVSDSDSGEYADSDEENAEDIVIQLPEPDERYSLRSRGTPFGDRTNIENDLSPDDLEKILEKERDRRACVVCQDSPKCVLVLPCRHMCLCVECAHHIASTRLRHRRICPLCRTRMETVMNVYI